MNKLYGLAWDDEPDLILNIKQKLADYWHIELEVTDDVDQFLHKLNSRQWDFVVTDLWDERKDTTGHYTGNDIAQAAAKATPLVFVLTGLEMIVARGLVFPGNVLLKTKNAGASWLAKEIHDRLKERNIGLVNKSKVFLIYGHDWHADGARNKVAHYLDSQCGLTTIIGDNVSLISLPHGIYPLMAPCHAFVAICTPDDQCHNQKTKTTCYYPRGNVLAEMGAALGIARDPNRLIILQKWGATPDHQASLPSDFDGLLTLRFDNLDNILPTLQQKLINIGAQVAGPT